MQSEVNGAKWNFIKIPGCKVILQNAEPIQSHTSKEKDLLYNEDTHTHTKYIYMQNIYML